MKSIFGTFYGKFPICVKGTFRMYLYFLYRLDQWCATVFDPRLSKIIYFVDTTSFLPILGM